MGNPTAFLTKIANETRWSGLIGILHRLPDEYKSLGTGIEEKEIFEKLNRFNRLYLRAVTCCVQLNKLLHVIMSILCSKRPYYPFKRYRVVDYCVSYWFTQDTRLLVPLDKKEHRQEFYSRLVIDGRNKLYFDL